MDMREHSFSSIFSKPIFFFTPNLGGIKGNEIKFNEIFTKNPKIALDILLK